MTTVIDRRKTAMGAGTGSKRALTAITKIARHWSGGSSGNSSSFENYWKNTLKWSKGGYHEVILRNGDVEQNYDPTESTNGVGGHNSYIYNICLVAGPGAAPTAAQEATFKERALLAISKFSNVKGPQDVWGHNEFPNTATYNHKSNQCPGVNMDTVRANLSTTNTTTPSTPTASKGKVKVGQQASYWAEPNRKKIADWVIGQTFDYDAVETTTQSNSTKKYRLINQGVAIGWLLEQDVDGFKASTSSSSSSSSATTSSSNKKYTFSTQTLYLKTPQMSGTAVKTMQEALASIYFYPDKGAKNNGVDGYFGAKTEDAVKRFQSMHGLTVDGRFGPATRAKLESLVNK